MENFRKALSAVKWSMDSTLVTINHFGLAMVIAGWLQAIVTDAPVNWPIVMVGLALIFISLMRHPKWTTSP